MPETNPTDALAFLSDSIQRLHQQGYFVTGSVVLHDFRRCPTCKAETIFVDNEHLCPNCMAAVRLLTNKAPEQAIAVDKVPVVDKTPKMAPDAPFCTQCGGQMMRSGTCYTCTNCGTTSGCS